MGPNTWATCARRRLLANAAVARASLCLTADLARQMRTSTSELHKQCNPSTQRPVTRRSGVTTLRAPGAQLIISLAGALCVLRVTLFIRLLSRLISLLIRFDFLEGILKIVICQLTCNLTMLCDLQRLSDVYNDWKLIWRGKIVNCVGFTLWNLVLF